MNTYIVLLRGINVGGNKKVPMADLRSLLESEGLENVQTYIQTGNIIMKSEKDLKQVEQIVDQAIQEKFGFTVSILGMRKEDLQTILSNNPFSEYGEDELYLKKLNVTFLKKSLSLELKQKLEDKKTDNESFEETDHCLYLWCGDGFGNSKLASEISKYPDGTTRNWNTVMKLTEML